MTGFTFASTTDAAFTSRSPGRTRRQRRLNFLQCAASASRDPPKNPVTIAERALLRLASCKLAGKGMLAQLCAAKTIPFCARRSRIVMIVVTLGAVAPSMILHCFTVASPSGHNAFMQSNSNGARSRIDRVVRRSAKHSAQIVQACHYGAFFATIFAALPISIAPALRRALPDLEDTSQA